MSIIEKIFGIKNIQIQRDDMYSLTREGLSVEIIDNNGRLGSLDRPHIFEDGTGEIIPASKLRSKNGGGIERVQGRTLKHGPPHSHDRENGYHLLEEIPDQPTDLLGRFRKRVKAHRKVRRESRDR